MVNSPVDVFGGVPVRYSGRGVCLVRWGVVITPWEKGRSCLGLGIMEMRVNMREDQG